MSALSETSAASLAQRRDPGIRILTRTWLAVLFVLGLGYIVLVPPFQAVDEVAHWDRVWTVARGDYNCKKIPESAAQFVELSFRFDNRQNPPKPVSWSLFQEAYAHTGTEGTFWIATNGCHYPPVGYLPAAAAVRAFTPGPVDAPAPHKMFLAHYLARVANWLSFFACVVAAVRVSRFPMPVLVFASIPMVVHQAISINNDAFQFGGLLLALALLTAPPSRARIWSVIAIVVLLSAIKPINAIAATFVWLAIWRIARAGSVRRLELAAMTVASLALPLGAWLLWDATMRPPIMGLTTGMVVPNTDQSAQMALLLAEPIRFLKVIGWQLSQVFTEAPIQGGWRGIVLALGWYRYVAPDHVYALALAAFALGAAALRVGSRGRFSEQRVPRLLVLAVLGSVAAYFVAVTLILYLSFTPVAGEVVLGVQGRYFLYPLAMLLFVAPLVRSAATDATPGRSGRLLAYATAALSVAANVAALYAVRSLFWEA